MFPFPLYFITDPLLCSAETNAHKRGPIVDSVADAIDGGARLVQYRDKMETRRTMFETAKKLRNLTAEQGVTLIINDEIDLALAVQADGVHLGQEDLPINIARRILGEKAIIGISTHHLAQATQAQSEGADYIAFGPIFKTGTKDSQNAPVGIEAIARAVREIEVPLYAIGGIKISHLSQVMAAGAAGVAVVSGLAGDVRSNVSGWLAALKACEKLDKFDRSR